jgi:hypothetical protein
MRKPKPSELDETRASMVGAVAFVLMRWPSLTPATRAAVFAHLVAVIDLVLPQSNVIPISRRRH